MSGNDDDLAGVTRRSLKTVEDMDVVKARRTSRRLKTAASLGALDDRFTSSEFTAFTAPAAVSLGAATGGERERSAQRVSSSQVWVSSSQVWVSVEVCIGASVSNST